MRPARLITPKNISSVDHRVLHQIVGTNLHLVQLTSMTSEATALLCTMHIASSHFLQPSQPTYLKMSFSKNTSLFALVALFASLAAAAPPTAYNPGHHTVPPPAPVAPSCGNTGELQCCNSLQDSDSQGVSDIFDLLGTGPSIAGSNAQVGFACSPIVSDTGLAGDATCSQQTACCSDTQFNGVIALGCLTLS
ncbi:hypothetical protein HGRIS_009080 [Hohenbuehelia grisea]|uniref:Hydrophobin n=1 Tax=Hohenbuehelia grisea TaxID=104357 RepID=A0ABR3J016_9AGAR